MKGCYYFFHKWIYPEFGVRHCTKCLRRDHWNSHDFIGWNTHGKHPLSVNDSTRQQAPDKPLPLRLPVRPI